MGLSKTSSNIEHLSHKFGNKELQERYRRMYLKKHPEIEEAVKNIDKNRYTTDLFAREVKERELLNSEFEKFKEKKKAQKTKLKNKLEENSNISPDNYFNRRNKINDAYYNSINKKEDEILQKKLNLSEKYDKLEEKKKDKFRKSKDNLDKILKNKNKKLFKISENMRISHEDFMNSEKKRHTMIDPDDIKLRDKFKKRAKKRDKAKTTFTNNYEGSYTDGENIWAYKKHSPFTVGHEAGHIRFNRQSGGGNKVDFWINSPTTVENLADEAAASGHALSTGKLLGATPKQLKEGRKDLENAFDTYSRGLYNEEMHNFINNYRV